MKKLILLGFMLAGLFTAAPVCQAKQWIKIESKNFVLVGDARESDIKMIGSKLEQFRLALITLFPNLKLDTPVPTRVYVFEDFGSFDSFRPQYKGKTKGNVAGYFIGWPDQNVIALTTDPRNGDPLRPIFHEYEHALVQKSLGRVPAWLNEGLAEFFSTFYVSDRGKKAAIGEPIAYHGDLLRQNSIWPLTRLFAVDRRSPDYNESSRAGIFYAQSWALVHYLMFKDVKQGTQQFSQFIDLLISDVPVETAFARAFQRDYRTMEGELRKYIANYSFPAMDVEFREKLTENKDLVVVKLPEAETELYVGELYQRLGRFDAAVTHLSRATILDPGLAEAHLSLGSVFRTQKKLEDAEREFSRAISSTPKDHRGYRYRASNYSARGSSAAALADYRQAIALAPNEPVNHSALGYHFARQGEDEPAVAEFSAAVRLDDQNADYYRALAFALLRVKRGQYAAQAALKYLKLNGWNADYSQYSVMCAILGYRQAGKNEDADKLLQLAGERLENTRWPLPAYRFVSDSISASELLAQAGSDGDRLVEARTFIGLRLALSGDSTAAKAHLEWVVAQGLPHYVEYNLANLELQRIVSLEAKNK